MARKPGRIWLLFRNSKIMAAPMFQFEFETALFRLTANAPSSAPLLQLPPTIAVGAKSRPGSLWVFIFNFLFGFLEFAGPFLPRYPHPCGLRRDRLFAR